MYLQTHRQNKIHTAFTRMHKKLYPSSNTDMRDDSTVGQTNVSFLSRQPILLVQNGEQWTAEINTLKLHLQALLTASCET